MFKKLLPSTPICSLLALLPVVSAALFHTSSSAQAASFVTKFETNQGNVILEWSGEDEDGNSKISVNELSGPVTLSAWGDSYDLGSPDSWFSDAAFVYNTSSSLVDVGFGELAVGTHTGGYRLYSSPEWQNGWKSTADLNFGFPTWTRENLSVLKQKTAVVGGTGASSGGANNASTPEPTLTLGLITLGGLMLGSKRKTKG